MEEKEVSLLDLLVVVAENLKLLIFGPIVIGLLALGIGYILPQSYTSQAILVVPAPTSTATPTPTQAAAMMVVPLVLDPVIESLNLSAGSPAGVARAALAKKIKATVGKEGLLRLDVTANTPFEAQALANAVIESWLKTTVPSERDRADLEKRLAYANVSLESVRRLLGSLTSEGGANFRKPLERGDASAGIVAVSDLQARYLAEVLTVTRLLQGFSREVVVQPPTLPTEPVEFKKSLMAVLATLGGCLVLLLWVFMRQAWKTAAQDAEVAEKQARLRAAMGLKGRSH